MLSPPPLPDPRRPWQVTVVYNRCTGQLTISFMIVVVIQGVLYTVKLVRAVSGSRGYGLLTMMTIPKFKHTQMPHDSCLCIYVPASTPTTYAHAGQTRPLATPGPGHRFFSLATTKHKQAPGIISHCKRRHHAFKIQTNIRNHPAQAPAKHGDINPSVADIGTSGTISRRRRHCPLHAHQRHLYKPCSAHLHPSPSASPPPPDQPPQPIQQHCRCLCPIYAMQNTSHI